MVSTVPPGRMPSRPASDASAGRAATFSSAWVIRCPITAMRSTTPFPACGPSSGSMTAVPDVSAAGSPAHREHDRLPIPEERVGGAHREVAGLGLSRAAMAGVIGTRSVDDSHVPGMPEAAMSARNGEPPCRCVYQRRVSRWRSGRCRTYDPDPERVSTNPSATKSRTASTATRSATSYSRASSCRGGHLRAGREYAVHDGPAQVVSYALIGGRRHATSLTNLSTQVQAEYSALCRRVARERELGDLSHLPRTPRYRPIRAPVRARHSGRLAPRRRHGADRRRTGLQRYPSTPRPARTAGSSP